MLILLKSYFYYHFFLGTMNKVQLTRNKQFHVRVTGRRANQIRVRLGHVVGDDLHRLTRTLKVRLRAGDLRHVFLASVPTRPLWRAICERLIELHRRYVGGIGKLPDARFYIAVFGAWSLRLYGEVYPVQQARIFSSDQDEVVVKFHADVMFDRDEFDGVWGGATGDVGRANGPEGTPSLKVRARDRYIEP